MLPSLKQQQHKDLEVFFNFNEFADFHVIDGIKYLCVFTSDTMRSKNKINAIIANDGVQGLSRSSGILFMLYDDIDGVNPDQPLRIDDKLYTVDEAVNINNWIWRISVSGTE